MSLKPAFRSLRKEPVTTAIVVVVLALGIGANTAIFSVIDAVLLRALPFPQPERMVMVLTRFLPSGRLGNTSAADFNDWRQQSTSFEALAIYSGAPSPVSAANESEEAPVYMVSAGFFDVLKAKAALGRFFIPQEEQKGGPPVAVISYRFWQRHFNGGSQALGQQVKVLQTPFTIVGVLSPGVEFPADADVWMPLLFVGYGTESRTAHNYRAIGRLKPGVTLAQAQSEMSTIAARLGKEYPEDAKKEIGVAPVHEYLVKNFRPTLYLLFGGVSLILLIACANVANLLLAKSVSRRQEMAVRTALGARPSDIFHQLIAESLVLALPAAALGLLLGFAGARVFTAMNPANLPTQLQGITLDTRILIFTIGISILASVLFGLAPALHALKVDINEALKQRGNVGTAGASGTRAFLVVLELAFSVVLLAGAALLLKSLTVLTHVDPGYQTDHVLTMAANVPSSMFFTPWFAENARNSLRFYDELLSEASALPGVESAAAVNAPPITTRSNGRYTIEGRPDPAPGDFVKQQADFVVVTPNYFSTLRIPFRRGRDFNDTDHDSAPLTCIINEALARESFPDREPIGQRIRAGMDLSSYMTIVGIVADVRQNGLDRLPSAGIYMPFHQHPGFALTMNVLVRTNRDPALIYSELQERAHKLNPEVPIAFSSIEQILESSTALPRFRTILLASFSGLALLLSIAGLYAVISYLVNQHARDIGIRMALGAQRSDILRMVLSQGMRLVMTGLAVGVIASLWTNRSIQNMLYGVKLTDASVYAAVALVLMAISALALYFPAHRATTVNPMSILRDE